MNGILHLLAYPYEVNLIGNDIRTIQRNVDVVLNAWKDIGLGVNPGKTKYIEIGRNRGRVTHLSSRV